MEVDVQWRRLIVSAVQAIARPEGVQWRWVYSEGGYIVEETCRVCLPGYSSTRGYIVEVDVQWRWVHSGGDLSCLPSRL